MEQLGGVAAQMSSIESLFSPLTGEGGANTQPTMTQSLNYVRGQVETAITEFTSWRSQVLSPGAEPIGQHPTHTPHLLLLSH